MPSEQEILFGKIAVEQRFVTSEQLMDCIDAQEKMKDPIPLGLIMVEKGLINEGELNTILAIQDKHLNAPASATSLKRRQDVLFGRLMVKKGFLPLARANEALREQAKLEQQGTPVRLGKLLVDRGWASVDQVVEVLDYQKKKILFCEACESLFGVAEWEAGKKFQCKKCSAVLIVPQKVTTVEVDDLFPEGLPAAGPGAAAPASAPAAPVPAARAARPAAAAPAAAPAAPAIQVAGGKKLVVTPGVVTPARAPGAAATHPPAAAAAPAPAPAPAVRPAAAAPAARGSAPVLAGVAASRPAPAAPARPIAPEPPSTKVPFAPELETLPTPRSLVDGPWFIAIGTNIRGPMPMDQVKEHIARRELTPDCLVWKEGMKDWEVAKNVRPIALLFGVAAARPPAAAEPPVPEHDTARGDAPLDNPPTEKGFEWKPNKVDEEGTQMGTQEDTLVVKASKILVGKGDLPQIDGYQILEMIGKGGMGEVYKATQVAMERPVAIKVLASRYVSNKTFVERFLKEARASAKLSHPNIIQGIDVRESHGKYCFIMEYVDGPRVGDILRRGGAMDPARALNIVMQVARALEHAHKHGIIHRDIKPDNIMLTKEGQAKLCDLGMAMLAEESAAGPGQLTGGTPNYLAPEQARGDAKVDARADIYCLGTTFYHMTVGALPFTAATRDEVMRKHISEPPVPPIKRNPGVPPYMSVVILKMMEKHPDNRYQSATELIKDLSLLSMGSTPMVAGGPQAAAAAAPPAPQAPVRPRTTARPTRLPPRRTPRRRLR